MDPYSELDFIDLAHRLESELRAELPHLCTTARYDPGVLPTLVVECPLADIEWTARFALPPSSAPLRDESVERYIFDGVISRLWQVSASLN